MMFGCHSKFDICSMQLVFLNLQHCIYSVANSEEKSVNAIGLLTLFNLNSRVQTNEKPLKINFISIVVNQQIGNCEFVVLEIINNCGYKPLILFSQPFSWSTDVLVRIKCPHVIDSFLLSPILSFSRIYLNHKGLCHSEFSVLKFPWE